jgi:hypothetical protein
MKESFKTNKGEYSKILGIHRPPWRLELSSFKEQSAT